MEPLPNWSKLFIAAGTYDGALAGWELQLKNDEKTSKARSSSNNSKNTNNNKNESRLALTFATACHDGSVRYLCFASAPSLPSSSLSTTPATDTTTKTAAEHAVNLPGSLLSCGFDEMLRTHDWSKRKTGLGEVRTPSDFGTPLVASFAPPPLLLHLAPTSNNAASSSSSTTVTSTHCLVGFSQGKIVIYKKRDWSVQHVLAGHEGGVASLAVHPSGKLALSGGQSDGKLKLWDLTKGRLAYATQIQSTRSSSSNRPQQQQSQHRRRPPAAVNSLVWSPDGMAYGFCHGTHITVRHVDSGKDLLDVDDMPSRVNQIALLSVEEGLFVAAACDDGSLPVLAVQLNAANNKNSDDANENEEEDEDADEDANRIRRAIMAIEPVDAAVAGEERFKCIQLVSDYHVVTANSAGVVSLMSLKGAIQMITKPLEDDDDGEEEENDDEEQKRPKGDTSPKAQEDDDDEEEELAVEILDSVQLGHGTRITCLAVWAQPGSLPLTNDDNDNNNAQSDTAPLPTLQEEEEDEKPDQNEDYRKYKESFDDDKKRRRPSRVDMDPATIKKARELVSQAKELQQKRDRKRRKKNRKA